MTEHWTIEPDALKSAFGIVSHNKNPQFTAKWDTGGLDTLAEITGLCWSDEASGEDDQIHIHGFDWTEPPPDQEHFETLMIEAVQAIDKWIAKQM